MGTIKHEHITVNGLQKSVYTYWFNQSTMRLDLGVYEEFKRRTPRSKWEPDGSWDRTNRWHNEIDREDIPGLHDVGKIVLQKFIEQITVEVE